MLQTICNYIVLISATLIALGNIYKIFKKPVDSAQNHQKEMMREIAEENFDEKILEVFQKHSEQTKEEHKQERAEERAELLDEMEKLIVDKVQPNFDRIEQINIEQNQKIELLMASSRDMLRQHIIDIYRKNKHRRILTETEREFLDDCFRDYQREDGNGYIEKLYHRMDDWKIDDEVSEFEE